MKKLVVLLVSVLFVSCSEDTVQTDGCNCGTITKVVVGGTVLGNTMRTYTVKNDCTGVVTTVQSTGIVSQVGEKICD